MRYLHVSPDWVFNQPLDAISSILDSCDYLHAEERLTTTIDHAIAAQGDQKALDSFQDERLNDMGADMSVSGAAGLAALAHLQR